MGFSEFWSQSNNNKFFYPAEIKKGDEYTLDELAQKLNVDKLKLQSLFIQADTDENGKVSQNNSEEHNELQALINSLGASFSTSQNGINVFNYTDNNGTIVTEEYDNNGQILEKTIQYKAPQDIVQNTNYSSNQNMSKTITFTQGKAEYQKLKLK